MPSEEDLLHTPLETTRPTTTPTLEELFPDLFPPPKEVVNITVIPIPPEEEIETAGSSPRNKEVTQITTKLLPPDPREFAPLEKIQIETAIDQFNQDHLDEPLQQEEIKGLVNVLLTDLTVAYLIQRTNHGELKLLTDEDDRQFVKTTQAATEVLMSHGLQEEQSAELAKEAIHKCIEDIIENTKIPDVIEFSPDQITSLKQIALKYERKEDEDEILPEITDFPLPETHVPGEPMRSYDRTKPASDQVAPTPGTQDFEDWQQNILSEQGKRVDKTTSNTEIDKATAYYELKDALLANIGTALVSEVMPKIPKRYQEKLTELEARGQVFTQQEIVELFDQALKEVVGQYYSQLLNLYRAKEVMDTTGDDKQFRDALSQMGRTVQPGLTPEDMSMPALIQGLGARYGSALIRISRIGGVSEAVVTNIETDYRTKLLGTDEQPNTEISEPKRRLIKDNPISRIIATSSTTPVLSSNTPPPLNISSNTLLDAIPQAAPAFYEQPANYKPLDIDLAGGSSQIQQTPLPLTSPDSSAGISPDEALRRLNESRNQVAVASSNQSTPEQSANSKQGLTQEQQTKLNALPTAAQDMVRNLRRLNNRP